MGNDKSNPLDAALKRLEPLLGQVSLWAIKARRVTLVHENPSALAAMIAREPVIRDAISESCREWIQSGDLKPMTVDDAHYFYDRLDYGEKMIRWLRSDDLRCPSKTANEVLMWLVVDSWELVCLPLWKQDLTD